MDLVKVRRERVSDQIISTNRRPERSARCTNTVLIVILWIVLSDKLRSTLYANQGHIIQDITKPLNVGESFNT